MALIDMCGGCYARDHRTGKLVTISENMGGRTPEGREYYNYMLETVRDVRFCKGVGIDYNPVRDSLHNRKNKDATDL